jgi:hypothetical protein
VAEKRILGRCERATHNGIADFFFPLSNQTGLERLPVRHWRREEAVKHHDDIVPLAVMCSLSAAIMLVFIVTAMH